MKTLHKKLTFMVIMLMRVPITMAALSNDDFDWWGPEVENDITPDIEILQETLANVQDQLMSLKDSTYQLTRQVMMQQFSKEETVRSGGHSGILETRGYRKGEHNYDSNSHISRSAFSTHDHSNYDRTIGMGEVSVVMNGVEFRTRHNDYRLVMPSTTSTEYHATELIPFPPVPDEVLRHTDVEDQIAEMREWFRAFQSQNTSHRDYRPYFKPVLCYMEGAWTLSKNNSMEEPFTSDRHRIDATSWLNLEEKVRHAAYSGVKSRLENFAYLPTTIIDLDPETGNARYAQWNYRILCKPYNRDIPTKYLRPVEDVSYRMSHSIAKLLMPKYLAARFTLYHGERGYSELLDDIFYTIPGPDNLPRRSLNHDQEDLVMYRLGRDDRLVPLKNGFYNRWFKYDKEGAMGLSSVARGFNDDNLFVAQTSQERIAGVRWPHCGIKMVDKHTRRVCEPSFDKFAYAIPLEIIYLTPLLTWNPFDLHIFEEVGFADADKRNGGESPSSAYMGVDKSNYYMTPHAFFRGKINSGNPADTIRSVAFVLDKQQQLQKVVASGTRMILPTIEGIGAVRLRYPIAPVYGEGSSVWKELNAVKHMLEDTSTAGKNRDSVWCQMLPSDAAHGTHVHSFRLSMSEFQNLLEGQKINVTTDMEDEHVHDLRIAYYGNNKKLLKYERCDGLHRCWDSHPMEIDITTHNGYTQFL